jgi:hypothetical protein
MSLATPVDLAFKMKIRINGREYASADEMPVKVRAAYARAVGETAVLRSGARLATKLNARVIINDKEFSSPSDMPVAERRLYQDTLAALLPGNIAVSSDEIAKLRFKKALLTLFLVSALAALAHSWVWGFLGRI